MATNKLKAKQIEQAKPGEKPYKLADGDGMYLLVDTKGGRYWRLNYRYAEKQKTLALGPYPDVSLEKARTARDEARKAIREGIDPGEQRKVGKITKEYREAISFEAVAREWHRELSPGWTASTAKRNIRVLERSAFPWIGERPIAELTAPELLACIRRTGCANWPARCSASASRPGAVSATLPAICEARSLPRERKISRRSPSLRNSASCCGRSGAIRGCSIPVARSSSALCSGCGLERFASSNGRRSISRNG